jgi:hypothetical protein
MAKTELRIKALISTTFCEGEKVNEEAIPNLFIDKDCNLTKWK